MNPDGWSGNNGRLCCELQRQPTFNKQLARLMEVYHPDEEDLARIKKSVHDDLYKFLIREYPRGIIYFYGSSDAGLALVGSDLDIFFDENGLFGGGSSIQSQLTGSTMSESATFNGVYGILSQHPGIFRGINPIHSARVPVIKFKHIATDTDCDFTLKGISGVLNSQLVKCCLTLDSRIKPLIIVIKFWANEHNLHKEAKFSNYRLVLMILFYLQQPGSQLLPPMKDLRRRDEILLYGQRRVYFEATVPSNGQNCLKSIPDLLRGFFQFYSQLEFGRGIISPYYGFVYAKPADLCSTSPWESFACLEDPIERDRNVIGTWDQEVVQFFQSACRRATANISACEENLILPKLFRRA